MSVRVQAIIEEGEAVRFKSQAHKESKLLSAMLKTFDNNLLAAFTGSTR